MQILSVRAQDRELCSYYMLDQTQQIISTLLSDPRLLVILGLIALGTILKKFPDCPNDWIPVILLLVSELSCVFMFKPIINAVLFGFVFAAIAVYSYELIGKRLSSIIGGWLNSKFGNQDQNSSSDTKQDNTKNQ